MSLNGSRSTLLFGTGSFSFVGSSLEPKESNGLLLPGSLLAVVATLGVAVELVFGVKESNGLAPTALPPESPNGLAPPVLPAPEVHSSNGLVLVSPKGLDIFWNKVRHETLIAVRAKNMLL